jgi:hypothetical protein
VQWPEVAAPRANGALTIGIVRPAKRPAHRMTDTRQARHTYGTTEVGNDRESHCRKPLDSNTRCTSPTDRQQKGHAGTKTTASTSSARIRSAITSAVSSTRTVGSRMYPIKD